MARLRQLMPALRLCNLKDLWPTGDRKISIGGQRACEKPACPNERRGRQRCQNVAYAGRYRCLKPSYSRGSFRGRKRECLSPREVGAEHSLLAIVYCNAYAKTVYVDRAFQKKTNELVQRHIDAGKIATATGFIEINADTIELIKRQQAGDGTKVINLIKSIEKTAEDNSDDPFLIALAERAKAVQESYEDRQTATSDALEELLKAIEGDQERKREQAARGLDGLSYFVLCKLNDEGVKNAEAVTKKVREAFAEFPHWRRSQNELRQLRQKVTFAVYAEEDDLDRVAALIDSIFSVLQRTGAP